MPRERDFEDYERLAAQGDVEAMRYCASVYLNQRMNREFGRKYLKMGCEAKDFWSCFRLATHFQFMEDSKLYFSQMNKLASKGYLPAIYMLSRCYREGVGVSKDLSTSNEYLEDAARKGYLIAQHALLNRKWKSSSFPKRVIIRLVKAWLVTKHIYIHYLGDEFDERALY